MARLPEFPARLGRQLSVMLAAVALSVLLVGGVSALLAREILRGYDAVAQENEHFMFLGEIQRTFLQAWARIERLGERRAWPNDAAEARQFHAELGKQLDAFEALHRKGRSRIDRLQEASALDALRSLHRNLGEMIAGVTSPGLQWDHEQWDRLAGELARAVSDLERSQHQVVARQRDAGHVWIVLLVVAYIVCLLVGGWLFFAGTLIIRRRIIAPLRRLADTAGTVAEGRFEVRVPIDSQDEVGRVSHLFNLMLDHLQARAREINNAQTELTRRVRATQQLSRIGTEVAALKELDPVLRLVVDSARDLLQADAATLCLRMGSGNAGILRAVSGPPDAAPAPGTRICDACMAESALAGLSRTCPLRAGRCFKSHLPVSILRQEAVIGVLCVGMASQRTFTAEEAELLTALATHTGIAVEKASLHNEIHSLAATQERERIAREMHDGLAQSVGLLHLKLKQMQLLAEMGRTDPALLPETIVLAAQVYDEVRESIFGLRIGPGSDLLSTLTAYVRHFSQQSGIRVQLDTLEKPPTLSPLCEVQVIRIVQEALTNIRKHAGAERARVRVSRRQTTIEVSIEDDGCGANFDALIDAQRFGVRTMRERAESVGGCLSIESVPGRGTRVLAAIPEGR